MAVALQDKMLLPYIVRKADQVMGEHRIMKSRHHCTKAHVRQHLYTKLDKNNLS